MTFEQTNSNVAADGEEFVKVEITGLSTETKPETFNGKKLLDGSTYLAIDTCEIYMWSQENEQWYELA